MAPFGTVLKNGILFLILTAGITYLGAYLIVIGFLQFLFPLGLTYNSNSAADVTAINAGIRSLWLGLLTLIGGIGIVYMKSLSDVIEDGLIEF